MQLHYEQVPGFPWLCAIRFTYQGRATQVFKQYPGVRYAPELGKGVWLCPVDVLSLVLTDAKALGYAITEYVWDRTEHVDWSEHLREYQKKAVLRVLAQGGGIVAFEMGLGKTVTGIEVLKQLRKPRVLIVGPAVARSVWKEEFDKFWSEQELTSVSKGTAEPGPYTVTSYKLLGHMLEYPWDAVVFDEIQALKNPKSSVSKKAKELRERNPEALMLGLTGTPMADRMEDVHHPVDVIFPGRLGSRWKFMNRYANKVEDKYAYSGFIFRGINDIYSDELRDRLSVFIPREVKSDHANLLPPFTVQTQWLDKGVKKQRALLDWALDMRDQGQTHLCIMAYHKQEVWDMAEELRQRGFTVCAITGEVAADSRQELLLTGAKEEACVAVCTISSVGKAINALIHYPTAAFMEYHEYPEPVLQAIARFQRVGGKHNVNLTLFGLLGSKDEVIVHVLKEKVASFGKLLKSGSSEDVVLDSFKDGQELDWAALATSTGVDLSAWEEL